MVEKQAFEVTKTKSYKQVEKVKAKKKTFEKKRKKINDSRSKKIFYVIFLGTAVPHANSINISKMNLEFTVSSQDAPP